MEHFFNNVYEKNIWGNNHNTEYSGSSGNGSRVDYNKFTYIPFLKKFIKHYNIKNVTDLGCGDFRCGKLIYDDLDISYTGYDIYKKVTDYNTKEYLAPKYSFIHLDFFNNKENILNGELCILKDVIQHWQMDEIYTFLDFLVENKVFKYILICNCCNQTIDNPKNNDRYQPLSSDLFPLKKYKSVKVYKYHSKEVSVIYT